MAALKAHKSVEDIDEDTSLTCMYVYVCVYVCAYVRVSMYFGCFVFEAC